MMRCWKEILLLLVLVHEKSSVSGVDEVLDGQWWMVK